MPSKVNTAGEMSFLEHLDELRKRLIRCIIAIAVFFLVGWAFSDKIFNFLQVPVTEALQRQRAARSAQVGDATFASSLAAVEPGTEIQYTFRVPVTLNGVEVPAGTTIAARVEADENGTRQIVPSRPWGVGGRFFPEGQAIPLALVAGDGHVDPDDRLVVERVQGAFNLYVEVAFYTAFALSIPFILFQVWMFVAPGLYPHERFYVWPVVIFASFFFFLGVAFAYEVAFPAACDYLVGLGTENFHPLYNADEYFDLIFYIMLGLGFVFQIPTVTFFAARLGLVTAGTLIRVWKYAVVAMFIVAAIASPTADIPNMLVFASPMIVLYGVSIGIAFFCQRRRPDEEALEEAQET
jgi:sec-independent protein translocase protein TatC